MMPALGAAYRSPPKTLNKPTLGMLEICELRYVDEQSIVSEIIAVSGVSNSGIAFDQVTDICAKVCLQQYLRPQLTFL